MKNHLYLKVLVLSFSSFVSLSSFLSIPAAADQKESAMDTFTLKNDAGITWQFTRGSDGWTMGEISLHGKPVDAPLGRGVLALRKMDTGEVLWLPAAKGNQIDAMNAEFRGKKIIDNTTFLFEFHVALNHELPAVSILPRWTVDKDLAGWELCVGYHGAGLRNWRCTVYPFAGNAPELDLDRVTSVGVPAVLLFRPDLSLVTLFGIDPAFDYFNPKSWTGATGFHFKDGAVNPQYRFNAGKMEASRDYIMPMQVFLSDAGNAPDAITALVQNWIRENNYKVERLFVRTPKEAFELYLKGRRATSMWIPQVGYQLEDVWPAVYLGVSSMSAYFEYLLFEKTGDAPWRQRCIEQLDFLLKAQNTDAASPHYGYIHTCYMIKDKTFNSDDRGTNVGYKIDMDIHIACYILLTWERLKKHENIDRQDWHNAAVHAVDWAIKQRNPDGGLPQKVDPVTGVKSVSVVSGRALAGLPDIYRITGDEKYGKIIEQLEQFLRDKVEGRFWFTGQHPDLYPEDFESDSVWNAVQYWLGKYARTNDPDCLKRARADAYFAFLMLCPKQLSWVKNPTQTCHTEQFHYQQYSNYSYHNKKLACLFKLGKLTKDPLFTDLFNRIIQCNFWAQVTDGPYCGAQHERLADAWNHIGSNDVNSTGTLYMNELSLDANLQLLELGLVE